MTPIFMETIFSECYQPGLDFHGRTPRLHFQESVFGMLLVKVDLNPEREFTSFFFQQACSPL